ncbi:hypothetical protein [Thermogemmatispora tikiterensis]|uniref:Uncharacterized protein n=1 Tax=Thermogemmatispora tikiterensis TaxID=1825093 RepID=A0A328V9A3_9CHLR|nr:hypothetical protein [Thermogemmatispora tikiterensis]RAQ94226.1 hypothetical protein A4R35_01700 [Thermogemmatispora tikiterensis]
MSEQHPSSPLHQRHPAERLQVWLELVPASGTEEAGDLALLTALHHQLATDLQQEGFVLHPPASTGQKGAPAFFIEAWLILQQVAGAVWQQHAAIAEGLADLSALVTLFEKLLPVLKRLRERHARLVGQQASQERALRWTIELGETRLTLETADLDQAEAALQLAQKLQTALASERARSGKPPKRPATLTVRGTVPPRRRRKGR